MEEGGVFSFLEQKPANLLVYFWEDALPDNRQKTRGGKSVVWRTKHSIILIPAQKKSRSKKPSEREGDTRKREGGSWKTAAENLNLPSPKEQINSQSARGILSKGIDKDKPKSKKQIQSTY